MICVKPSMLEEGGGIRQGRGSDIASLDSRHSMHVALFYEAHQPNL